MTITTQYNIGSQFYHVFPAPEPGKFQYKLVRVLMININRGSKAIIYELDNSDLYLTRQLQGNIVYTDGYYWFRESDIETGDNPVAFLTEEKAQQYVEKYNNKELEYPDWYYKGEDVE